jgi:Xaa-Pro aminopeptidase
LESGWARPRNFAHNVFPFRAESHFLHFGPRHIEGACLVFAEGAWTLYVLPPDPELILFSGPTPSPEQLAEELGLRVRTIDELRVDENYAALPPQDDETAAALSVRLGRPVAAQSGPLLQGGDGALADAMVELRLCKDEAALTQMLDAATKTAAAHRAAMAVTHRSGSEAAIRAAMEGALTAQGLGLAYNSIVTTQGEILHAPYSRGRLHLGDLLLCDVGGESPEGYAADVTRTWPVSGAFTPTQRDAYELVLSVQKAAIADAKPGTHYADLHLAATRHMAEGLVALGICRSSPEQCFESGLASVFFPHGLGHLLGLDVHDMEDLGDRAGYGAEPRRGDRPELRLLRLSRVLEENMVVTVEPGFYQVPQLLERAFSDSKMAALIDRERLQQFSDVRGIRIEDDVWISAEGPRVLSAGAPKEIDALEAILMQAR